MGRLYPMFSDILGRPVVVIGGGSVSQRKVEALLECGAEVTVIAPELTSKLGDLADKGSIAVKRRFYAEGDTEGAWLVIAACGDVEVNRQVFSEANASRIFCNVVDQPDLCSFQVPSVVQRDPLQIAISTGGVSPALAKRIRKELEGQFGGFYETYLGGLRELREHIKGKYPEDQSKRAVIFEGFVNSEAWERLRAGQVEQFRELLEDWKAR